MKGIIAAEARRRLYTSVAALVRRLRRPGECVWHWAEYHRGEVSVLLIDRRSRERSRRTAERLGRGGGFGRSLEFRKVGGRWQLVGRGRWVT